MLKGLYVITDESLTPYKTLINQAKELLQNGVGVLQLRDKGHTDEFLLPYALELKSLCDEFNATFIVNDRLDLALKSDAHGVHIGLEDVDFNTCRTKLKDKIIGVSCYGDLNRAIEAERLGADYVAFGACFSSSTKPNAPTISVDIFKKAKKALSVPICAIGGITSQNITKIKDADMICVVKSAFRPDSITKNIQNLKQNLFSK